MHNNYFKIMNTFVPVPLAGNIDFNNTSSM
jgi:hypothetical protein